MSLFKKLLVLLLPILVVSSIKSMEPAQLVNETIAGNLKAACPQFAKGFHGVGLGLSRFILDGSQRFAQAGKFCADHYILSGLGIASAVYFYTYIWPEVNINVTYSNHQLVRVQHQPRPGHNR